MVERKENRGRKSMAVNGDTGEKQQRDTPLREYQIYFRSFYA
jgi:hypothetical protein